MLATTERFGESVLSFGLPSAPAMYLNIAKDAYRRKTAINLGHVFVAHPGQGTWPEAHGSLFDFFEQFSVELIFSFTALEAFANEAIPVDFAYQFKAGKKAELTTLAKAEIERRVSLDEKLSRVLPEAHGLSSPSGTKTWQDFKELKDTRDRLIHMKSVDRKASGPEHQTLWGLMLEKRNVAFPDLALNVIEFFTSLVKDRRWFRLCSRCQSR